MTTLIATIILTGSLLGMGVIVSRKIPVLLELPEIAERPEGESLILRLKRRIDKLNPFKNFSYEIFLQKILTKIRILTLKTDNKTFDWLQKLRKRAHQKKLRENDNYWEEIKKATKSNKKPG
ncbi:MAG: hypothetical protein ACE5J0_01305 [Candidatus Paceibacterales bacterium]